MKMKIVKWVVGGVVVSVLGLIALGYSINNKAESFVTESGLINATALGSDDKILCAGNRLGIVVKAKASAESPAKFYPICVSMFRETLVGKFPQTSSADE